MKTLLVEDDTLLGDGLRASISKSGFAVTWVKDGKSALALLKTTEFSVMILDIGLPVMTGLQVLNELRKFNQSLPVLMLTSRDSTRDKVTCLEHGADDYLLKTADMEELIARLRVLIRRTSKGSSSILRIGDLTLDPVNRLLTLKGTQINASNRELALLRALMESAGRTLSRSQLEVALYGWTRDVDSNSIEVHIHNLRLKLGSDIIKTVRGMGYTVNKTGS